ncbi:MAG: hypothetical protein Q4D98_06235 [Planctomycetia bacterium]|nr:hypothetical protein [Planctomycetia bacterium]
MKKYLLVLGIAGLVTITAFAIRANDLQKTVPPEKEGAIVVIEEVVKTPEGAIVEEAIVPVEQAAPAPSPAEEKKEEKKVEAAPAPAPAASNEAIKAEEAKEKAEEEKAEQAEEKAEEAAEETEAAEEAATAKTGKTCPLGVCPLTGKCLTQEECCCLEKFLCHVKECAQKHACHGEQGKVTPAMELGLKLVEIDGKPVMVLTVLRGLEHHFLLPLPGLEKCEKEEMKQEQKEK